MVLSDLATICKKIAENSAVPENLRVQADTFIKKYDSLVKVTPPCISSRESANTNGAVPTENTRSSAVASLLVEPAFVISNIRSAIETSAHRLMHTRSQVGIESTPSPQYKKKSASS